MMGAAVAVGQLVEIQRRAMRRRVWFKALDRAERAIVTLTIRCVDRIRSQKLAEIVKAIVAKLREAMKGRVKRLMEKVGRQLAQKLSQIAKDWGNVLAVQWAEDPGFVQYLAIMHMNTPRTFQL